MIDGQKMFTTNAQIGDYAFLLARTDPDVPKHEGFTMFLVPLDQPGVEVQAVYTLSGERTNITFYNEVRVDDRWRIGEVDEGWRTLTVALAAEHAAGFGSGIERLLDGVRALGIGGPRRRRRPRIEAPDVQLAVGRAAGDLTVSRLLQRRVAWCRVEGDRGAGGRGSDVEAVQLGGVGGSRPGHHRADGPRRPAQLLRSRPRRSTGVIEHMLRFSLGTTIYAGTSEVHRNMIAQRGLGLPR